MKRHATGRDAALSARITAAAMLLLAWYALAVFGVVELFRLAPGLWPYWAVAVAVLVGGALAHYRSAESLLVRSAGGEISLRAEDGERIRAVLGRLAELAQIEPPGLVAVDAPVPNSFAVGLRERRSTVVVTPALLHALTPAELEAVIAHEVAHIANREAAVMTAASVPETLAWLMLGGDESSLSWIVTIVVWPLAAPLILVGMLLTLTVSRYREFAADRGAALLTGAPEQLMSALQKLARSAAAIPSDDLRQLARVEPLCIVSTDRDPVFPGLKILADHPPLERRLDALAEISREMGKLDR